MDAAFMMWSRAMLQCVNVCMLYEYKMHALVMKAEQVVNTKQGYAVRMPVSCQERQLRSFLRPRGRVVCRATMSFPLRHCTQTHAEACQSIRHSGAQC